MFKKIMGKSLLMAFVAGATVYRYGGPEAALQLAIGTFGWCFAGLQLWATMNGGEVNWENAPINHYHVEMYVPAGPTQLRRESIDLSFNEWLELWQIARDLEAGESFTSRNMPHYHFWRKRFITYWKWAEWKDPSNHLLGITLTPRGEEWLAQFANSPSPKVAVSNSERKPVLHTHQGD
jgi:hypothetical protein